MTQPKSPEKSGDIQAQITYLRARKVVLDQLIESLELYTALGESGRKAPGRQRGQALVPPALAGAA